jgi:hypothetical protein
MSEHADDSFSTELPAALSNSQLNQVPAPRVAFATDFTTYWRLFDHQANYERR